MRPYAGCDAWFVIRPSALRPSVATQPMHPARHQIVSGCSARAYPPARGHGQGLVSLPELGDHLLGSMPLPVRALHLKLLSATWATKVSRSGWTCSAHPRQRLAATCRSDDHCVTSGFHDGLRPYENLRDSVRNHRLVRCRAHPPRGSLGGGVVAHAPRRSGRQPHPRPDGRIHAGLCRRSLVPEGPRAAGAPARTSIATLVGELGDGLKKTQQCDSRSLRA